MIKWSIATNTFLIIAYAKGFATIVIFSVEKSVEECEIASKKKDFQRKWVENYDGQVLSLCIKKSKLVYRKYYIAGKGYYD